MPTADPDRTGNSTVSFSYDSANRRTSLTLPNGGAHPRVARWDFLSLLNFSRVIHTATIIALYPLRTTTARYLEYLCAWVLLREPKIAPVRIAGAAKEGCDRQLTTKNL